PHVYRQEPHVHPSDLGQASLGVLYQCGKIEAAPRGRGDSGRAPRVVGGREWPRRASGSSRATRWAAESVKFFTSKRSLTEKTRYCMISRWDTWTICCCRRSRWKPIFSAP